MIALAAHLLRWCEGTSPSDRQMSASKRSPAKDSDWAFRRVPPWSKFWKPPPEGRATVTAFDDEELSVDLKRDQGADSISELRNENADFLAKGFGMAQAPVIEIRAKFNEASFEGEVFHDPLPENQSHGLILGTPRDRKADLLFTVFKMLDLPNYELFKRLKKQKDKVEKDPLLQ